MGHTFRPTSSNFRGMGKAPVKWNRDELWLTQWYTWHWQDDRDLLIEITSSDTLMRYPYTAFFGRILSVLCQIESAYNVHYDSAQAYCQLFSFMILKAHLGHSNMKYRRSVFIGSFWTWIRPWLNRKKSISYFQCLFFTFWFVCYCMLMLFVFLLLRTITFSLA